MKRFERTRIHLNVFAEPSQNDKILTKDEENLESTTNAERN